MSATEAHELEISKLKELLARAFLKVHVEIWEIKSLASLKRLYLLK